MNNEEIRKMNIDQVTNALEELLKKINEEEDLTSEDLEKVEEERKALLERQTTLKEIFEKRSTLEKNIKENGVELRNFGGMQNMNNEEKIFTVDSPEYRTAFWKQFDGRELTEIEERALNTGIVAGNVDGKSVLVPTETINNIWDQVALEHAIVGDVTVLKSNTVIEMLVNDSSTDAETPAEGVAPAEGSLTVKKVVLGGIDISKYIETTYAMAKMSIQALEAYITNDIANRIGDALAKHVVGKIHNGVANANKIASTGLTYEEVLQSLGVLKRVQSPTIYATRKTIYNNLYAMKGEDGHPIFVPATESGAIKGHILGTPVKIEDTIEDNTIYVGDAKKFTLNVVQDLLIEKQKDIRTHVNVTSGYMRAEGALLDTYSFAEIKITPAKGK